MNAESKKRPFVTANFALTWDGRISTRRGTPADFSSKTDKRRLVEIRARCDAVLVSAKTAAADNMSMGLPDAALRADYGVRRLVCEGGAQIFRALLAAGLIDELHVTLCPRVFGGEKAPTLTGLPGAFLPASVPLTLKKMEVIGGECFLRYRVAARLPH